MAGQRRIESEIVSVALGGLREPPVDLDQVAEDIQVRIRRTNFRSGFTDFSSTSPVIYLNEIQLPTTRRFILAHELAHVILRLPAVMHLIATRGQQYLLADEEALADRIAATILVPDPWIETLRTRCSVEQLKDVARLANVSVMVLVARMASSGINIALLHWRRGSDAWHVIDRPGVPPSLHGYVKPSSSGYWAIEKLHRKESDIVVPCLINGKHAKIGGKGYRHESHAFQLLEPSIDIWISSDRNTAAPYIHASPNGASQAVQLRGQPVASLSLLAEPDVQRR